MNNELTLNDIQMLRLLAPVRLTERDGEMHPHFVDHKERYLSVEDRQIVARAANYVERVFHNSDSFGTGEKISVIDVEKIRARSNASFVLAIAYYQQNGELRLSASGANVAEDVMSENAGRFLLEKLNAFEANPFAGHTLVTVAGSVTLTRHEVETVKTMIQELRGDQSARHRLKGELADQVAFRTKLNMLGLGATP